MNEGFQIIDIIFFAMIAAFLVLRLRSVLGRRDGHESGHNDNFSSLGSDKKDKNNVVQLSNHNTPGDDEEFIQEDAKEANPLLQGFSDIKKIDSHFDPDEVVSGSQIAFEMILGAYSEGDTKTLKPLLNPEVFSNFAQSIKDREQAGETLEETLVGIKKAEAVEAYMEGSIANITVKFVSDQINAVRDESGEVIDGNPDYIAEITDFWTFARDTKSRDPNWLLVATRSLD
ncbi:MAG TPA: Tim44/TimA family putative adaptor protein [Rhodospirillales bacterium]|nr:Tim44/TimA family putative adaptor protein [Rhodospirillales bacterium]